MSCPKIRTDGTFPAETRKDYESVAHSLRKVIDDTFCHGSPPLSLPIVCRLGIPPRAALDSWSTPREFLIDVNVEAQIRPYSQFAFQLAHEVGHCYAGVYRSNFRIETVVTALSLDALSRLTRRWKSNPPHHHWLDYAPRFQEYRTAHEDACLAKCPAEIREAAVAHRWDIVMQEIGHTVGPMDTSKDDLESEHGRALQTVAAMALLSQTVVSWSQFIGIEQCTVPGPGVSPTFSYAPFDSNLFRAKAPSLLWLTGPG